jgi:hypothetical protein
MTSVKHDKTALVVISAALVVSIIAIGNGRMVLAAETTTITKNLNNAGINVQTTTDQKQECQTTGGSSPISAGITTGSPTTGAGASGPGSCSATSTSHVSESGGELNR